MSRIISPIILAVVLVSTSACSDKQSSLVGTWKLVRANDLPAGAVTTWIFNKEGTASTTLVLQGGQEQVFTHKWRIEGTQLMVTKSGGSDQYDVSTILKLTDTTLVVKNASGAEEEFKRLK